MLLRSDELMMIKTEIIYIDKWVMTISNSSNLQSVSAVRR